MGALICCIREMDGIALVRPEPVYVNLTMLRNLSLYKNLDCFSCSLHQYVISDFTNQAARARRNVMSPKLSSPTHTAKN